MKLTVLRVEKTTDNENIVIFPVLLQNENRKYLIDCGYEETFDELRIQLKLHNVDIKDLTGVIITHDDYDHLGGLKQLKQSNPTLKIYCGALEKDTVSGKIKSERLLHAENSLSTLPEEYKTWALNFIKKLLSVKRFEVDETFDDNEYFENDILVIHTPGHTKGHISIFYLPNKTVIAGDALVIENGKLNIANPQFTLNMSEALKSVEKIKKLNPQEIICYHGGTMDKNIAESLEEITDMHIHK